MVTGPGEMVVQKANAGSMMAFFNCDIQIIFSNTVIIQVSS